VIPKIKEESGEVKSKISLANAQRQEAPYERIKQAILTGELLPGAHLVESALAQTFNVSRTPIREALTRLEQDGIIQRGERGLVVRESSQEEILDLYDTRIVLESHAAAIAAERRTSHDLLAMRRAQERVRATGPEDALGMAQANREFHRKIWKASHNESLIDLLERLNLHLGRYPATTLVFPDRPQTACVEHDLLIEAIEARDAERASSVASRHFKAALDIRLQLWEAE
jgi:DNA-binding GntR family transcriptional regulator